MTIGSEGLVVNPASTQLPDGLNQPPGMGRQSDYFVSEIHGKFYHANYRNSLFCANVTAVTIPVIAPGLVSVFSLYNPLNSNINMELVDLDIGQVLATTVVDAVGLYFHTGTAAAAATFTTKGAPQSCRLGGAINNVGLFYSALTHSGTPTRVRLCGSFGATTDPSLTMPHFDFDGRVIIAPGTIVSVAMSTAAGTTSGLDISMTWAEWPL